MEGNLRETLAGIKLDSLFENKRQLHLHTVLRDMDFVIEHNFLILDPCGADLRKSFPGANKARLDCIIETPFLKMI